MPRTALSSQFMPQSWMTRPVGWANICGAVFIIAIWFTISVAAVALAEASWRASLISADTAVLLGPVLVRILTGQFDLFEPILMADFAMAGMYVGRPLADILTGHFHEHSYDISASYDSALLLVLCSNLAFQVGYFAPFGKLISSRLPRARNVFKVPIVVSWAAFISIMGTILFSIFLASQGGVSFLISMVTGRHANAVGEDVFATSSAYTYNGMLFLVPGSTMIFALWLKTNRRIYLVLSLLTITPYMILQVGGGVRSGVVGLLFGLPLMWYVYRRKRPSLITLAVGGLLIAFIFSFIRDFRNVQTRGSVRLDQYTANPVTTVLQLFTTDDDEMFDVIAQEIEVTPSWVPYTPLGVFRDIAVRSVPRTLWIDKPIEMDENVFATMEPARFAHSHAGTATSLVGYFYLEEGFPSALIWMFVMGVALRGVWEWFLVNKDSMLVLMIYSTIIPAVLTTWRGSLPWYFANGFFTTLPLVVLALLQRFNLSVTIKSRPVA